jgi:MFS family permease
MLPTANRHATSSIPQRDAADHARVAVAMTFGLNGLAFASWVSRLPAIKAGLGLTAGRMGLLLLCLSAGTLIALPLSGALVQRIGPARAVGAGVAAVTAGTLLIAFGVHLAVVPVVAAGLLVSGLGMSTWDVSMNVQGADVERQLQRTLMPRFHAAFSLGAVAGALVGAASAAGGVPVSAQLVLTAPLVAVTAIVALRSFLPMDVEQHDVYGGRHRLVAAWRDSRTRLVGVLVLAFALTEGVANDWLALAVTDGVRATEWLGSFTFGAFVLAMTAMRFNGGWFLQRFGRVAVLRATAAVAMAGALLVAAAPSVPVAVAGAVLWGAGASLGFPVGMSAAAADPSSAAARVSVVSTIGYTAFLAGPPLVGLLADAIGVQPSLLVVVLAASVGLVVAPSTRDR